MPTVAEEFHRLKDKDPENAYRGRKWVNELVSQKRDVNVMEWKENGKTFQWVTNRQISKENIVRLSKAGRKR